MTKNMTFSDDPKVLIMKIFDNFRDETIFIRDWLNFMAISYNYMKATPLGIQRYNFETVKGSGKNENIYDIYAWNDRQNYF